MDMGESGFLTGEEAVRFIQEAAAKEKPSYMVTQSDKSRFCVACVDAKCPFQVLFLRRRDGKFHITHKVAHSCTIFQTTATPAWIRDVVEASITNNAGLTTSELRDIVSTRTQQKSG